MSEDLLTNLVAISEQMGSIYSLSNKPITTQDVFSTMGLLPAIARRADQLCSLCFGYGIGVSFEESEESQLGVKVIFDEMTPNGLRYLCILDVIYELLRAKDENGVTALDELMYD
jgi:intracellular multiplication protein IcmS